MYETKPYFYGTGRRKNSVARVRVYSGTGKIIINDRDIDDYFGLETLKLIVRQPLAVAGVEGKFDIVVRVSGPGAYGLGAFFCVGQRACACALGLRTQGGPIAVHMPGGTLWVRAEPTSAMPAQGTAQTGAPHPASAPNGMRVLARTGRPLAIS